MSKYDYKTIETKWRAKWAEKSPYKTLNPGDAGFSKDQKKYYILDMFPYPSGSGLHVGHASGYIGTDIVSRKKRMEGYNVLHPMGWDAFGLPAEQYAITQGKHPRETTDKNTKNFKKQLDLIGLSYDWSREIDTSSPDYYKWTQWLFLKLCETGLVYQKSMPVWWCEELKTVLSNEEVINGKSERGNHPCERRPLNQWMLKITAYADRLVKDLDLLDWPESVKKMQTDWIGKSVGAEITFDIKDQESKNLVVFTTRPDTLFGVVAMAVAPEADYITSLITKENKTQCDEYILKAKSKSERERKAENKDITGVFTGSYAIHPLTEKQIPIYIADYVLADYGTGAVMAVPAHDDRDYTFAKTMGLDITPVIEKPKNFEKPCFTGHGAMINSDEFNGLNSKEAQSKIIEKLVTSGRGIKKINYKIRDWIFSRQRYWGEPFPLYLDKDNNFIEASADDLPITLPEMTDFTPNEDGSAPLNRSEDWVNLKDRPDLQAKGLKRVTDTMPGWAGSCWYYLRFMDPQNSKEPFSKESIEYWDNVDLYVGGASHATLHLLYARFWHKVFFDLNIVSNPEPFQKLFNQGMVTAYAYKDNTGRLIPNALVENKENKFFHKDTGAPVEEFVTKMAKSLGNVVTPDDMIENYGCDALRLYEMFLGPLNIDKPWNTNGITGCVRFINKFWSLFATEDGKLKEFIIKNPQNDTNNKNWDLCERAFNKCLQRVNDSFEVFNFNTAVAAFMEWINDIQNCYESMSQEQFKKIVLILSPFCPHISAEFWELLGHKGLIDQQAWPKLDKNYLGKTEVEFIVSINGKVRKKLQVKVGIDKESIEKLAREALGDKISDNPRKIIFVKDKLINFVL